LDSSGIIIRIGGNSMANLLDTLDKAKEVVNGIKDISTIMKQ